jgi:hypothetical protein
MTSGTGEPAGEVVEEYLDRLFLSLRGTPRQVRRTLAEAEAHLADAVTDGLAGGLSRPEAEAAAVARFGPAHAIGGGAGQPAPALVRRGILAAALVGGVALIAVGLSGGIAWALARLRGGTFVTAPFPPGSYTRADCARWLANDPGTHSCLTAMTADHVGDIVLSTAAAGLLGVLTLLVFWGLRRRWQDRATLTALPAGSTEAAGAVLAALVALAGLGVGVNTEMVQRGVGAGQPFSLAIAAAVAAAFFALRLARLRRVRARLG